jgi:hypothetical protein
MLAAATANPAIGAQTRIVTSVAKALLFKKGYEIRKTFRSKKGGQIASTTS